MNTDLPTETIKTISSGLYISAIFLQKLIFRSFTKIKNLSIHNSYKSIHISQGTQSSGYQPLGCLLDYLREKVP